MTGISGVTREKKWKREEHQQRHSLGIIRISPTTDETIFSSLIAGYLGLFATDPATGSNFSGTTADWSTAT